ncbi:MAG: hypothetical protein IJ106_10455 [Parasporobacterium sp.]|nr:hypothetical protein [Parasporobacterium sp.]
MGSKYENLLEDGSGNIIQSFFDNFLKSNADFRAKAGFRMTVIRESIGVCCAWCQDLVGTYDYDNRPADIYARHKNCTCVVTTKTERGTYQDAWSRKEYDSQREARVAREQEIIEERLQMDKLSKRIRSIYGSDRPGRGVVNRENGYKTSKHKKEINCADWLIEKFGGDVRLLKEVNKEGVKTPDYLWKGKLWEHKTASSINSIDKQLQTAIHQIAKNPGGVIIELPSTSTLTVKEVHEAVLNRIERKSYKKQVKVIIKKEDDIIGVIKH